MVTARSRRPGPGARPMPAAAAICDIVTDAPPGVRRVECSGTEGTVSLDWGQWTMRVLPGRLAVRAEAADQESLRRIQDLLTARLQKFGRREHLTVHWQDLGG